jgi:hypothetical protein
MAWERVVFKAGAATGADVKAESAEKAQTILTQRRPIRVFRAGSR